MNRLASCPSLDALWIVWDSIADDYRRDPDIKKFKDDLEEELK